MEIPTIGWTDKTMCLAHIQDDHLRARLSGFVQDRVCSFCEAHGGNDLFALNLEHLAEITRDVAVRQYEDANDGFRIDGQLLGEELDTLTVVYNLLDDALPADILDDVVSVVAGLINEPEYWVERDQRTYVELAWEEFARTVKHETRLVVAPRPGSVPTTPPERLHSFLTSLSSWVDEDAGLMTTVESGTSFFRARIERDAWALQREAIPDPARTLGPAPAGLASAGRMNAQGISLFYAAMEAETACAEVVAHSPYGEAVVGEFTLQRPLRILDLTRVPARPSVFDESAVGSRVFLSFFDEFRDAITRPVILDGKHPVDYAPTQVVTEFLRWGAGATIDGIAWESKLVFGGTNVVLFFGPGGSIRSRDAPAEPDDEEPVFVIDPRSVKRYTARKSVEVAASRW